jgi:hypothetical protein
MAERQARAGAQVSSRSATKGSRSTCFALASLADAHDGTLVALVGKVAVEVGQLPPVLRVGVEVVCVRTGSEKVSFWSRSTALHAHEIAALPMPVVMAETAMLSTFVLI